MKNSGIDILRFYDHENCADVIFSFKGFLNDKMLHSITEMAELKLNNIEKNIKIKKKVFSILIECVQNLFHHTAIENDAKNLKDSSFIMLSKGNDHYKISTGNYIKSNTVDSLKSRLDEVKNKNLDQLNLLYHNKLKEAKLSNKGGGGLGIIDIARKSNRGVNYEFMEVDSKNTLFSFSVKLKM